MSLQYVYGNSSKRMKGERKIMDKRMKEDRKGEKSMSILVIEMKGKQ